MKWTDVREIAIALAERHPDVEKSVLVGVRTRGVPIARRLARGPARQVFVTAPRPDELPPGMELETWRVENGRVIA